ncbi:MAG: hypothetical protein U0570_15745 [Phycisphaerales bacterium]
MKHLIRTSSGAMICWALVAGGMGGLSGCQSQPKSTPVSEVKAKPTPSVATVVEAQNARVRGLESLWARITLRVDGRLANAKLNREEAEGYLQVQLPDRVAIMVTKVGNLYFYLGSNSQYYWWFDLTDDKRCYFGRHDKATTATVDRFGIPVHPLDLIELMAITPLPAPGQPGSPQAIAWSADRKLLWYDVPARGSTKRVLIDPDSLQPVVVELLDPAGRVIVQSELAKYEAFISRSVPGAMPSVPTRCVLRVPRSELTINLNLNDPASKAINPDAFDLVKLNKKYPVNALIDLDKPEKKDGAPADGEPAKQPGGQSP